MSISFGQQKKQFLQVKSRNSLQSGTTAYLISAAWFNKWKSIVGIDQNPNSTHSSNHKKTTIPPIDNNVLLIKGRLKQALTEKFDFIILSEPLWKLFLKWYPDSGPEIPIELIDHPEEHKPVPILFELTFRVFLEERHAPKGEMKNIEVHVNKYQTIKDIKEQACQHFQLEPENTRLCDYWNQQLSIPINDEAKYIYTLHLVDTQELLLQRRNPGGSFPRPVRKLSRTMSRTNSSMAIDPGLFKNYVQKKTGKIGLANLGNTCFFNSAVQSLSHTPMFFNYFLSPDWRADINSGNRLSTNGRIANAIAQLVNDIWTKEVSSLVPQRLYDTIVEYAPRFGDHQQHDAQELMLFLLDGIHEDLNRAKKHVNPESIDSDLAGEETVAEAAWRRHKMANDSAIVDLFHGQLRSELLCPYCQHNKIVFDPYLCVTLPMPTERLQSVKYLFVPYDMKKPRCIVKFMAASADEIDSVHDDVMKRFSIDLQTDDQPHRDCIVIARDDLLCDFGVRFMPSLRKLDYFVFEMPDSTQLYSFASVNCEYQNRKNTNTIVSGPLLIQIPDSVLEHQQKLIDTFSQKEKKRSTKMTSRRSAKSQSSASRQRKTDETVIDLFKSIYDEVMETCNERLNVYWEETEYKMDDHYRLLDKQIANDISQNLLDWMNGDATQRFFVQPINSMDLDIDPTIEKIIEKIGDTADFPLFFFMPADQHPQLASWSMKIILNPLLSKESEGFHWPAVHPINQDFSGHKEKETITLAKCLDFFSYPDKLDELNEWFCPKCRKLVPAAAKLDIWSVPDNLILHIKRFVYKDGSYSKIGSNIRIPEILDMKPYITGPQKDCESLKYVLYSTIDHIGTMGGGHYTSSSFSDDEKKWFTFNDSSVYPMASKLSNSDTAYVLFYHRVLDNLPIAPFFSMDLQQSSKPRAEPLDLIRFMKNNEKESLPKEENT